ncbi:MAG: hypothetical protein V3V28_12280 [Polaribacter sp.]|uniref:hypothetical protein n=1 Tax=Polaribacter sp. TaxID=1920175 RepID=UPI002F35412D
MPADVNNNSLDEGIMNNSGLPLLLNITYLSSVAGFGVLFFLLKEVSISLKKGSLIPENSIDYLSQIIIEIIAGLIMSEKISLIHPNRRLKQ